LEVAVAQHGPLHHHADPFTKHLRWDAIRFHVNHCLAVGDVEVESGTVSHANRSRCYLTTEADRRSVCLVTGVCDIGRRPVVDEIPADAAAGDHGEANRSNCEGNQEKESGAFHRVFLSLTIRETPYAASTKTVQPYAAQTKGQPPVM